MLQLRKNNIEIWFNLSCHFPSSRGGLCLFCFLSIYFPLEARAMIQIPALTAVAFMKIREGRLYLVYD